MFINPKVAIQEGWITFPEWMDDKFREKCIQPNALDITADLIHVIQPRFDSPAFLSEADKGFHPLIKLVPDDNNFVDIQPLSVYDIHSDFRVNIPEGIAAELVIRSTLNRAGLALNSGLWDSGFRGNLGATLFNRSGPFRLALHTRVCQIKFIRSEVSGIMYAGGYNSDADAHWSENK